MLTKLFLSESSVKYLFFEIRLNILVHEKDLLMFRTVSFDCILLSPFQFGHIWRGRVSPSIDLSKNLGILIFIEDHMPYLIRLICSHMM